jgi:hypothetical protein
MDDSHHATNEELAAAVETQGVGRYFFGVDFWRPLRQSFFLRRIMTKRVISGFRIILDAR